MNFYGYKWYKYVIFAFLFAFIISGCKKDEDNPVAPGGNQNTGNKITLNGGGFNNQTFDLTGSWGIYGTSEGLTAVVLNGQIQGDSISVFLFFQGNQTGTFNWESLDTGNSGCLILIGSQITPEDFLGSDGSSGSTVVTSYGQVGQAISGTFSGTVINSLNASVNVSGSFSVVRLPDE